MQRGQARQVISVLLQRLVETTRIGATGGASSSPTESERDSAGLGGLGWGEGCGNPSVLRQIGQERILNILESQGKTIYDKK